MILVLQELKYCIAVLYQNQKLLSCSSVVVNSTGLIFWYVCESRVTFIFNLVGGEMQCCSVKTLNLGQVATKPPKLRKPLCKYPNVMSVITKGYNWLQSKKTLSVYSVVQKV